MARCGVRRSFVSVTDAVERVLVQETVAVVHRVELEGSREVLMNTQAQDGGDGRMGGAVFLFRFFRSILVELTPPYHKPYFCGRQQLRWTVALPEVKVDGTARSERLTRPRVARPFAPALSIYLSASQGKVRLVAVGKDSVPWKTSPGGQVGKVGQVRVRKLAPSFSHAASRAWVWLGVAGCGCFRSVPTGGYSPSQNGPRNQHEEVGVARDVDGATAAPPWPSP